MATWIDVQTALPEEKELVTIQVNGTARTDYYYYDGRWYSMVDLDRWKMNTSPYWAEDRAWYLVTEQIEGWQGHEGVNGAEESA